MAAGSVDDEANLLYVALTRAKRNLIVNEALWYLLTSSFINYSFEYWTLVQVQYIQLCQVNYSFESLEDCEDCEESNYVKCGNILEFKQTASELGSGTLRWKTR